MWGQLRTRGAIVAVFMGAAGIAAAPFVPPFVAVLVLILLGLVAVSWVHEQACLRLHPAPFYVYRLLDGDGVTLYVGSTNHWKRRALEHTDEGGEPWRDAIHSIAVHRHCHSEAQARRIEERMIRAITSAAADAYCAPLRNEIWVQPTTNPAARLSNWVWVKLYRGQSFMWHWCAWAGPSDADGPLLLIPRRPDSGDDWDDIDNGPDPENGGDLTATYRRHAAPDPAPDYTLLALPPVRDATRDETPLRSRGSATRDVTPQRDATVRTEDSTERHRNSEATAADANHGSTLTDTTPPPPNETPEDRKKRLARERQRRRRQAQKKAR